MDMWIAAQHGGNIDTGYHWRWVCLGKTHPASGTQTMAEGTAKTRTAAIREAVAKIAELGGVNRGMWF